MFVKIVNTFDNDVIACCQYYSGYLCFKRLYDLHRYIFLVKLIKHNCIDHRSEIDQLDFRDHAKLQERYGFNGSDSLAMIKFKVWSNFKQSVLVV